MKTKYDYVGPIHTAVSTWHKFFGKPEDIKKYQIKVTSEGKAFKVTHFQGKKTIEHMKMMDWGY